MCALRPRVRRLTEERVARLDVEHRLREVRAPEDDRARLAQRGDHRRVALGDPSAPRRDAERRRPAGDVEALLDRDRDAVERATRLAPRAARVGRLGLRLRLLPEDLRERVDAALDGVDAVEVRAEDLARGHFASREHRGERRGGELPELHRGDQSTLAAI